MFNIQERIRIINTDKSNTCRFCTDSYEIMYDEGDNVYCPHCAYYYGAIDEDQLREDTCDQKH